MVWFGRVWLAALAWDGARAKEVAQEALEAIGPDPVAITNVAIGLQWVCEMDDAVKYTSAVINVHPGNVIAASNHVLGLYLTGRWTEAAHFSDKFVQRIGNEQLRALQGGSGILDLHVNIPARLKGLDVGGVSEQRVQRELAACWAVLRERRVRLRYLETTSEEDPDSGAALFVVNVCVTGNIELELELEAALGSNLLACEGWDPSTLAVGFKYVGEGDADAST
jgi:hypothetical protein